MSSQYGERIVSGLPLLLGGAFMVYLAAADNTMFDYVLDMIGQTQATVAVATAVATAPLMFFAVGFFKLAVFHEWETIYQYEILLRKKIFYIMAAVLLMIILSMSVLQYGINIFNIHMLAGCLGFSLYLMLRMVRKGIDGA